MLLFILLVCYCLFCLKTLDFAFSIFACILLLVLLRDIVTLFFSIVACTLLRDIDFCCILLRVVGAVR